MRRRRIARDDILQAVRRRWVFVILGPSLLLLVGSLVAVLLAPHPIPRAASPVQRLYLERCASCHGANGKGSWRATLFLIHPGDLTDPGQMGGLTDDFLLAVIKEGGAPVGKPGMPAYGFHLSDEQIRMLIQYLRGMARP